MIKANNSLILELYNKEFYAKQIKRLKSQAGPYITPDQIAHKIKIFGLIKQNPNKAKQINDKVRDAIAQGRKPEKDREGVVIAPYLPSLTSQEKLKLVLSKKTLSPAERKLKQQYESELKRIKALNDFPLEIRNYNWNDIEAIVDQFPDPTEKERLKQVATSTTSSVNNLIYDKDDLQIFFGATADQCYIINKKIQTQTKRKNIYKWCISQDPTGASNYFSRYRFGDYGSVSKSMYFVNDITRPLDDDWHCMVIQVAESSVKSGNKEAKYLVTDSTNEHGDHWMPWEEILKIQPKLKNLKHLFVYQPLTEEEQMQQAVSGGNADTFKTYTSFKVKKAYIGLGPKNKIYKEDYLKLDPVLQYIYINVRTPNQEDENQFGMLQKLMLLFQDSNTKKDMMDLIEKASEIGKQTEEDPYDYTWLDVLANNPTVKASKDSQVYKRYKQLILDCATGVGRAMVALKNKERTQG